MTRINSRYNRHHAHKHTHTSIHTQALSEPWEPEQKILPVTLPQDRKTPEREVYQEVNCNGKEMNKKDFNYGNVVCGQGSNYDYSLA